MAKREKVVRAWGVATAGRLDPDLCFCKRADAVSFVDADAGDKVVRVEIRVVQPAAKKRRVKR